MKIKTLIFLAVLFSLPIMGTAQQSIIRGSYKKIGIQGVMASDITVGIVDNGTLKPVLQNIIKKPDYDFQFGVDNSTGIFGKLVFIGTADEWYPVYVGKNETIDLNVADGQGKLVGKLSKENEVINKWFEVMKPLRALVYRAEGRKAPLADWYKAITDATSQTKTLLDNLNTGNASFDELFKKTMPYLLTNDVLGMFLKAMSFSTKEEYPQYMQDLFSRKNYDMSIKKYYPFAEMFLLNYGFAKEVGYNNKLGETVVLMKDDLADPTLWSEFAVKCIEDGYVMDIENFDKVCGKTILAKDRPRYQKAAKRLLMKKTGGDPIDFTYPDVKGKKHSLSDYKGKVVVVDVWATWCAPCKHEIPFLETLQDEMKGKDVVFISASFDTDHAAWANFIKEHKMKGVQLYTNRVGPLVSDYQIDAVPRFMVFSKKGKTVSLNAPRPSEPALKKLIEDELKK